MKEQTVLFKCRWGTHSVDKLQLFYLTYSGLIMYLKIHDMRHHFLLGNNMLEILHVRYWLQEEHISSSLSWTLVMDCIKWTWVGLLGPWQACSYWIFHFLPLPSVLPISMINIAAKSYLLCCNHSVVWKIFICRSFSWWEFSVAGRGP